MKIYRTHKAVVIMQQNELGQGTKAPENVKPIKLGKTNKRTNAEPKALAVKEEKSGEEENQA